MTKERIQREIAMIMDSMRTAADSQREYSIGALSALLWVLHDGDMMRPQCFVKACEAWDMMREGVTDGR